MAASTSTPTSGRATDGTDPGGREIPGDEVEERAFPARSGRYRLFDLAGLAGLAVVAVGLRFWTTSPMWLDETLTVNIASLPLEEIPDALRRDGHPPLYYVLLHGWMQLFGTSDTAVRALAGIFGVATIPMTWLVGRRVGGRTVAWAAAVIAAALPFGIRYSTESRMYSLVMLATLVAVWCADVAFRRPRPGPLVGLAVATGVLLWSQYWALWLGLAAAVLVTARLVLQLRAGRRDAARATAWVLGALAAGAATFLPWVPTLLHQQAHTGTPWAARSMPPAVLIDTVKALGGGVNATNEVGGWYVAALMLLGVFGVGVASGRIELDLRTRPHSRPLTWLVGLTIAIGVGTMLVSNTAFQPRYNSVWVPLAVVLAGIGVTVLRGPLVQRAALALVLVASAAGWYLVGTVPRTQAADAARAIGRHAGPGDVVAVCPDQLGPALARQLPPDLVLGSFPHFGLSLIHI